MFLRSLTTLSLAFTLCAGSMPQTVLANPAISTSARVQPRLPAGVTASRYDLYFEPDLAGAMYEGTATIRLSISKATSNIVLNSLGLSLFEAQIASRQGGHGDFLRGEVTRDDKAQRATISFSKPLATGQYELHLKFSGRLSDKLAGFYLSRYKDSAGGEHRLATTQMEPTDARRMFPCFDEPDHKAVFKVTCAVPREMTAISNAAVEFDKLDERKGRRVISFKATPPMSTYLFALVVGDFKPSKTVLAGGKKVTVWAVAGKEKLTDYALDVAVKLMPYYQNYFGVDYPLDKLDLIAIPDFSAGAMENLGAITFRETALLLDEKASTRAKMRVTGIVAHEMAHLWFGDLVTMKWWNGLWLNEAFATWMATKASEHIQPEWRNWDDFALSRVATLDDDGLVNTRPVEYVVRSPEDAMEMFDEITYQKGGSLLRMLELYLSEKTFEEGIKLYMQKHKFANSETADLWQALSKATASKVDVGGLMKEWVFTPGCPLVRISGQGELSQSRYLRDGSAESGDWQIPLVLKRDKESERQVLRKSLKTALPVFVNGLGAGFFRTAYSGDMLASLRKQPLDCQEKISLASDVFALSYACQSPVEESLRHAESLAGESDPYVLSLLIGETMLLENYVPQENFAPYVRRILGPALTRLTFEKSAGESPLTSQLRGQLLRVLGTYGQDPQVIAFCRQSFAAYLRGEGDSDLLSAIANVVAYNGGVNEYEALYKAYKTGHAPEVVERNLTALTSFRQEELVKKTLDMVLTSDVRAQDGPRQLSRLLASRWGRASAWKFLRERFADLEKKFDEKQLPDLVEACSHFNSAAELEELKAFVAAHPLPNGRRSSAKTLEVVKIRVNFGVKQGSALNAALNAALKPTSSER